MNLFQGKQLQRSRAILELFQAPAYTTTERDDLKSPKEGQIIRNSTTNKLNVYLNGGWQQITSA
jgi:hypothetical protein